MRRLQLYLQRLQLLPPHRPLDLLRYWQTQPRPKLRNKVAEIYDLRGLNCPLPVLKTQKRLRAMAVGEELWVLTSDPLAVIDIPNFVREKGHKLVSSEAIEGGHRFLLQRG